MSVQRARTIADSCLFASVNAPKVPAGMCAVALDRATQSEFVQIVYGDLCQSEETASQGDIVSLPLWEALSATLSTVQRQRQGAKEWFSVKEGGSAGATVPLPPQSEMFILNYLSSLMLLTRRTHCFLQPPQSTSEKPAAERPSIIDSAVWLEKLPEAQRKQGHQFASIIRFASATDSAEEMFGSDPTAALGTGGTQWINLRNNVIESLTSILCIATVCKADGEECGTSSSLGGGGLCFSEDPSHLPDGCIPMIALREAFCALVVLSRYFKPEASEEVYCKLEQAGRGFQDRCQTSDRVMTSFARRVRKESTSSLHSTFNLKEPLSWTQQVPKCLERVLLRDEEVLLKERPKSASGFAQAAGLANFVHPWRRSGKPVVRGGDEDSGSVDGDDEDSEQKVWETADDAPATVALEDLRTLFFRTIPMEIDFNDGVSNSLRDLDQVVKVLRLLSRTPMDLREDGASAKGEDSFMLGVPQKALHNILFSRKSEAASVASARGKRGRDTDESQSAVVISTKQQPRVILPLKVGVDGTYKTGGVEPPLEATWVKHCKVVEN